MKLSARDNIVFSNAHMELFLNSLLFLASFCVVSNANEGRDLQSEIEEYLRTLTQSRNVYQGPVFQPPLDNIRPYPSFRSPSGPQLMPSSPQEVNAYIESVASAAAAAHADDGNTPQNVWPGFKPADTGSRNIWADSSASSSVLVKKPDDPAPALGDIREADYSSVKDVDAEENIDTNQAAEVEEADYEVSQEISSSEGPEAEPSPDYVQRTNSVSGPMARKASDMTTAQQNIIPIEADKNFSDVYFVAIVAGCSAAGIFGIISAGFCFYRLQKSNKASADVDYPAYGVTGPSKDSGSPNGDRKLAQSAQMYHYQHQKQQMIAVENASSTKHTSASDVDSEEENEEGDYTVYECPGLAPTGEMEVKNPLFNDDSTPMSPPVLPAKPESIQSK